MEVSVLFRSFLKNIRGGGIYPIVYSFGIGEEISFDLEMIKRYHAQVFAFDPTPKSIRWVEQNVKSNSFHFMPVGLSEKDGIEKFHLPKNPGFVSGSVHGFSNLNEDTIDVPMKSFETIVRELGHREIDVLKMDIEGMEFDVLEPIVESKVKIGQICFEVHDFMFPEKEEKLKDLLDMMKDHGWELAAVSPTMLELTFVPGFVA